MKTMTITMPENTFTRSAVTMGDAFKQMIADIQKFILFESVGLPDREIYRLSGNSKLVEFCNFTERVFPIKRSGDFFGGEEADFAFFDKSIPFIKNLYFNYDPSLLDNKLKLYIIKLVEIEHKDENREIVKEEKFESELICDITINFV